MRPAGPLGSVALSNLSAASAICVPVVGPVLKVLVPLLPEIGQFSGNPLRLIAGDHDGFEEERDPCIASGPRRALCSTAVRLPVRGLHR